MKSILLQVGALLITVSFIAFLNPRHLSLCESAFFLGVSCVLGYHWIGWRRGQDPSTHE